MRTGQFQKGDRVIFTKTKFSAHPGPRAEDISPSSHGESYSYLVKKFWVVQDRQDDRLLLQTRTGKQHWVDLDDPGLRVPTWWEQIKYRERFRILKEAEQTPSETANQH